MYEICMHIQVPYISIFRIRIMYGIIIVHTNRDQFTYLVNKLVHTENVNSEEVSFPV